MVGNEIGVLELVGEYTNMGITNKNSGKKIQRT
jgi:hypothetical protein